MIWYKYEAHGYMDIQPNIGFHLFKDEAEAKAWEKYMQTEYSGGITRLIGPANKQEIMDFLIAHDIDSAPELMRNICNDSYYLKQSNSL